MTMTTRHTCATPASVVLEGYSPTPDGLVHGTLETRVYVCDEHTRMARKTWFDGMTAFSALMESAEGHTCGEVWDMNAARG